MDIFEILDEKFNLYNQLNDLNNMLFNEKIFFATRLGFTFSQVFDSILFRGWKYSKGRSSIYKVIADLGLDDKDNYQNVAIKNIKTEVDAYKSLQLNLNMLDYAEKNKHQLTYDYTLSNKNFIKDAVSIIAYICNKAGMQIVKHNTEDYYMLIPRDEKVRTVAENTDIDTAILLYEYTSPLIRENYKEKRRILKLLANKYEALIKIYNEKYNKGFIANLIKDLSTILNNYELRHPNLNPLVPQYYKEHLTHYTIAQWLEIYDAAYQLILTLSMVDHYNESLTKIVEKYTSLL
ncbi:MAG: hypothetical protein NC332_01670 [Firmicutes bacterium]|nr:hypothetical protein [Bacillota bacterium]